MNKISRKGRKKERMQTQYSRGVHCNISRQLNTKCKRLVLVIQQRCCTRTPSSSSYPSLACSHARGYGRYASFHRNSHSTLCVRPLKVHYTHNHTRARVFCTRERLSLGYGSIHFIFLTRTLFSFFFSPPKIRFLKLFRISLCSSTYIHAAFRLARLWCMLRLQLRYHRVCTTP